MNHLQIQAALQQTIIPDDARVRWKMKTAAKKASGARRFDFIPFDEMVSQNRQHDWLIKDFLLTRTLILLFGETGSFKSFLAIGIGLCVATGIDWYGCSVKRPGPVFYICGEGFAGIAKRLKAWQKHTKYEGQIPFFTSNGPADFSDSECVKQIVEIISKMVAQFGQPALVIVDTLNRNFGTGDENSTADMTRFITGLDHLKHELDTTIMIVHHTGLGDKQRSRGSSALKAAVDVEYRLEVMQ